MKRLLSLTGLVACALIGSCVLATGCHDSCDRIRDRSDCVVRDGRYERRYNYRNDDRGYFRKGYRGNDCDDRCD